MKRFKAIIFILIAVSALAGLPAVASHDNNTVAMTDSVMIQFRVSKWDLDPSIADNARALADIDRRLSTVVNDSVYQLRHVTIFGGASPEGSVDFNKMLSENRAQTLFGWFDKFNQLSNLDKTFIFFGRDWDGVLEIAKADPKLPYKEETLALLQTISDEKRAANGVEPKNSLERIKKLRDGVPYKYLYNNVFPKVRASKVVIEYERILSPEIEEQRHAALKRDTVVIERVSVQRDTVYIDTCPKPKRKNR